LAGYSTFSENVTTTAGNVSSIAVSLRALPGNAPAPSSSALSTGELALGAGVVAAIAIGAGALIAVRRRPPRSP
ncbi:MAG TPA: hypothetical protein VGS23_04545, partial [Thermoplasmata archaeon]|nr:hypothetical protein [Thermoplasmata archaeon]